MGIQQFQQFLAIDIRALLLPSAVYIHFTLPDPPHELAALTETVKSLGPEERRTAQARARQLAGFFKAAEEALSRV